MGPKSMKVPEHIQRIQERKSPSGAQPGMAPKQQKPPPREPLDPRTPMEKMGNEEDSGLC